VPDYNQTNFLGTQISKFRDAYNYVDYEIPENNGHEDPLLQGTHLQGIDGDLCCGTDMRSIGHKSQHEKG
jgi:hypothetical protein